MHKEKLSLRLTFNQKENFAFELQVQINRITCWVGVHYITTCQKKKRMVTFIEIENRTGRSKAVTDTVKVRLSWRVRNWRLLQSTRMEVVELRGLICCRHYCCWCFCCCCSFSCCCSCRSRRRRDDGGPAPE